MSNVLIKYRNKTVELSESQSVLIGRMRYGATVEIDDPLVGRKHAMIKKENNQIFIKDLNSLNGTYLNGNKMDTDVWTEITKGDEIKIVSELIEIVDTEISESSYNTTAEIPALKSDFKQKIIDKGTLSIGRSSTNEIVLKDPTVSRLHARIYFEEGKFWVEDLQSANKTYVNGREVKEKVHLKDSDDIIISFYSINLIYGIINLKNQRSAIEAAAIQKKYPNNKIGLQSLSLEIPHSTFVALMGPSGCGKSTLLKCLNGDNPATSGEVFIHGLSLEKNFNLIKKKIGYVPQDDIIHKELTVYKTLYYAAKLRLPDDTTDAEIDKKIDKVINSLNLDQDKDKNIKESKVGSLSGGQRKRISIAVELLTEPTILFLDEPTSPLDPETIENFLRSLQNLTKNGTTILMVTHKPEDLNYVDQVIFLGVQGHLTYKGPSDHMTSHFGVNNIVEVYSKMSDVNSVSNYYQPPSEISFKKNTSVTIKRDKPDSLFFQLYWLIVRYLKIKLNDKGNLILLLAQPIIIAGLICLVFNEFSTGVLFMIAISAIWFGVSNAAKEIVSELSVYRRERMFNLNIHTYIISKWFVLSIVALVQSIIFISIIYINFKVNVVDGFPDVYLRSYWESIGFMFYLSFSATLMGLFLSSYFSTTEKVMTVVPIALMPQIMLAGVMTRIDNTLVELLSFTTLGRWGTEGLARIQDSTFIKNEMESDSLKSVLYTAPSINSESGTELVGIGAMKRLDLYNEKLIDDGILVGSMFDSFTANMVIIAILNILMYLLIYYSLKRKDSI
jgi:ABC-type multidrug transport system ATPase subunit